MTKLHASLPSSVFYVNAGNCIEILTVQIYLVFVSCDSTVNIVAGLLSVGNFSLLSAYTNSN